MPKPIVLMILDGWGYRESKEANAIATANTPVWDKLWQQYPHTLLSGSGTDVGLPNGQMGNSEVGHINIGAGRVVYQDLVRINKAIETGKFFENKIFQTTLNKLVQTQKALHIFGLLSNGGVHSHEKHIHALIKMAHELGLEKIYLHAFLDGRDTPPKSALTSLTAIEKETKATIATVMGRYYAMDRDKRWERTQKAFDCLTKGECDYSAANAHIALHEAYDRDETDEFVCPTSIGETPITVQDGDAIIFMNFRSDRARQITQKFLESDIQLSDFVSLTEYSKDLSTAIAYPKKPLENVLGEVLAQNDFKQLRAAETEKYAHVTFFFNGGTELPFPGEDRILVPSPKVATYDLQPEMSAPELTDELVKAIANQQHDVIITNFANPDMVGHTGNFEATVKAIETIDVCIGRVSEALNAVQGELIITADHGNAEQMFNEETQQPHTAHTSYPIPFLYVGRNAEVLHEDGVLSDIAPTILSLMELETPKQMTGRNLLRVLSD